MHVAAVQFDIAWEDKPTNHQHIEQMLDEAGIAAGTFVLLPELSDTGFSLNVKTIVDDQSLSWAQDLAQRRGIWLQMGYPVKGDDGFGRNCASIISPKGVMLGTYQKVHPFSYGREIDHYHGGDHLLVKKISDLSQSPTICPIICYDLRFPELWRLGALAGAEVFTIGANWPDARQHHWRTLLIARAIENQAYVVATNRAGRDPHLNYVGGSMIISPMGEVLAEADDTQTILRAELDLSALRQWREEFRALEDVHPSLLGSITVRDHS